YNSGGGNNFGGGGNSFGGDYSQNASSPMPHPAETANSAPVNNMGSPNSDFASGGDDDDYPF
ncbi:MAG: single-stranded DNA-binding protein, partial [Oscillospiraceae bacterium]|nr:single-stranded DNA-binding protein [Oscillospiraceae bacterium]